MAHKTAAGILCGNYLPRTILATALAAGGLGVGVRGANSTEGDGHAVRQILAHPVDDGGELGGRIGVGAEAEHDIHHDHAAGGIAHILFKALAAEAGVDDGMRNAAGELVFAEVDAAVLLALGGSFKEEFLPEGHVGLDVKLVIENNQGFVAERAAGEEAAHVLARGVELRETTSMCQNVWARTLECLRLSIDLVKGYGAQKIDILPYESLLPILQYYFFKSGKNYMENAHKQLIDDWFWTTIFSRRYSSASLTKMKEDADWITRIIDNQNEERRFAITITYNELRRINMKNKSAVKDGVLCILAANNPVDFNNGQSVKLDNTNASRSNAKENHHFFPYSRYKDFGITQDDINSLLNFAFISKSLNLAISNKRPSEYLSYYANNSNQLQEWLKTHFIQLDAYNAAIHNNFEDFVEARGKQILERINMLCKVKSDSLPTIDEYEESDTSNDVENDFIQA